MAEGHAVHHWAEKLASLVGETVREMEVPERWSKRAAELRGRRLLTVVARGKHLLLHFSDGWSVHCHALMYGSWQVGRRGMSLEKPRERIRLRLVGETQEAVFYNGPVMEILTGAELAAHRILTALGPDILDPGFDRGEAWCRLQRDPDRAVGEAVLDQTIVSGIGNIYKSEGLFLGCIDPRAFVGDLPRESVERLWDVLVPRMRDGVRTGGRIFSLDPALRATGERFWVYRRTGRPCLCCGETIRRVLQGTPKRATYYCPACQPAPSVQKP